MSYYTFIALNMLNLDRVYGVNLNEYIYNDIGACVTDGIYIGSLATAKSEHCLDNLNIGAIVNLSGFKYESTRPVLNIVMDDTSVLPSTIETYIEKFAIGVQAIKVARSEGYNVLIHCAAGINRSATQIAFYLIDSGLTYQQSFELLVNANAIRCTPLLTNNSFRYLLQISDSFKRNFKK